MSAFEPTNKQKLEQARRLIPILEAEIAAGETRSIFTDLLESMRRWAEEYCDHPEFNILRQCKHCKAFG